MPVFQRGETVVCFADQFLGMSPSKLLHNIGSFHVRCSRGSIGELFRVSSPEYFFQLEIRDATVFLRRNQYEASRSVAHTREYFQILFSYQPDRYQLAVIIDGDVGGDDACVTVDTTDIFIPRRLVDWAREVHFIRETTYESIQELLSVVVESIHGTQAFIRDGNLFPLFWDYPRASGGTKPVPKLEPQSMRIVWGRMQDESGSSRIRCQRGGTRRPRQARRQSCGRIGAGWNRKDCDRR